MLYFSIIYTFQILVGRFQNILNKALSKSWILDNSNGVNTKVALQGSNHLLSVKRTKTDKERVENTILGIQFVWKEK